MRLAVRVGMLFLMAVWLEQSLLPFLLPGRVSFRLVTLLIINLGVIRGPHLAAGCGFALGIMVSLLTGEPLGVSSLVLSAIGWTAGWTAQRVHLNVPGATFFLTIGLLLTEWALTSAIAWLFFDLSYRFSLANFLAAVLVSPAVFWLCKIFLSRPASVGLYT